MRGHRCYKGDTMGIEIVAFGKEMSVVLFTRNFQPIGTRFLTLNDHSEYFPTILIENNGDSVELLAYWQTRVSVPTQYNIVSSDFIYCMEYYSFYFRRKMLRIGAFLKEQLSI